MGHVDHGKTSLLDALRQADVVSGEAGGITQHIGAYQVTSERENQITFIDTPGHAAFTAMRSRGAKVTDIVVLVVAADDGIMPQTVEAIDHAKAAEVPVIVAINKMDQPDADSPRIRTQLLEHDIVLEAMGGDVLDVEVSAVQRTNLDKLEEAISLQAEILDLKSNPTRSAEGTIIESRVEPGRGPVATILVQRGTLKMGDIFVTGSEQGRVRAMTNDGVIGSRRPGRRFRSRSLALTGHPMRGMILLWWIVSPGPVKYRSFAPKKNVLLGRLSRPVAPWIEMFIAIQAGEAKDLPVLIKADVQGSAEAISGLLQKLPQDEVKLNILHQAIGGINESDIQLAKASGALVIGFNVRANKQARDLAESEGVDIRYYSVIYDLADDIRGVLVGLMAPELRETLWAMLRSVKCLLCLKLARWPGVMSAKA